MVISNDAEVDNNGNSITASQLVLSPVLLNFDTYIRYVSGEHYSILMLHCPTKTLTTDKCSGRYIVYLAKNVLANMRKASIIVDKWLVHNDAQSGTVWEDLYRHLITNKNKISLKEKYLPDWELLCVLQSIMLRKRI